MRLFRIVLYSALLLFSAEAFPRSTPSISAHVPLLRTLPSDLSLSDDQVLSLVQDDHNVIWVGTLNGLNKFDGRSVTKYFTEDGLSHNTIRALHLDRNHLVWVGGDGGLDTFSPKEGVFRKLRLWPNSADLQEPRIYQIFEDKRGTIWVGTSGGLFQVKGGNVLQVRSIQARMGGVRSIAQDSLERIWVGTERSGVLCLDESGQLSSLIQVTDEQLGQAFVRDILITGDMLWVATDRFGAFRYKIGKDDVEKYKGEGLSAKQVMQLLDWGDGALLASEQGLQIWNSDGLVRDYYLAPSLSNSSSSVITFLYRSDDNNVWVGTFSGLFWFNPSSPSVRFFGLEDLSIRDSVTAFSESSLGNVAVATFSGVAIWNPQSGKFTELIARGQLQDQIMMVEFDAEDQLWVGSYSGGIYVFKNDVIVDRFTHDSNDIDSIPGNDISRIVSDGSDVWISSFSRGLARHDVDGSSFTRFPLPFERASKGRFVELQDFVIGPKKLVWVATSGGVVSIDPITREFEIFNRNTIGLRSDDVQSVHIDAGRIYIGGLDYGLSVYERGSGKLLEYPKFEEEYRKSIYGILPGSVNEIWIYTAQAIYNFLPNEDKFIRFDERHGIPRSDFNTSAYAKLSSGHMLFGGNDGFVVVDPEMVKRNDYKPPVTLTSFRVNHSIDKTKEVAVAGSIELDHDEDQFEVSFAAMDFTFPSRNQYRYMLEGFDKAWIENGAKNVAAYTNIDAGSYVLRVMGSNSDGVWSDKELQIPIVVHPAIWATWWAYAIYFTLAAFMFYRVLSVSNRKIERQAEESFNRRMQLYVFSLDGTSECVVNADGDGRLLFSNSAALEVLGKRPAEILGCSIFDVLFQDEGSSRDVRRDLEQEDRYKGDHAYTTPDGESKVIEVSISRVKQLEQDGIAFAAVVRDVTARSKEENLLQERFSELREQEKALEEKFYSLAKDANHRESVLQEKLDHSNALLREIHDRISDNLQTIMSLMSIQSSEYSEPEIARLLQDNRLRLNALTLVHEHLYSANNGAQVDMSSYLNLIAVSLYRQLAPSDLSIQIVKDLDEVLLPISQAVPCGLIASELISNALLHAYEGKQFGSGKIEIKFHLVAGECVLFVSDDGKGLPLNFAKGHAAAIGMEVVSTLVTQLDGTVKLVGGSGASFEIRFPVGGE